MSRSILFVASAALAALLAVTIANPMPQAYQVKGEKENGFFCKTNNVALCGKRQFAADVETILKDPLQETFVCEGLPYG